MTDPLVEYERLWSELERSHQQIVGGHAIHVPTFHRTVKAFEASVLGVMAMRQTLPIAKSSQRARQCDGKQRFSGKASALAHVATHPDRDKLEVYPCVWCQFYHYGNASDQAAARGGERR